MDYLSFITGEFNKEIEKREEERLNGEPQPQPQLTAVFEEAPKPKEDCKHLEVLGDPR